MERPIAFKVLPADKSNVLRMRVEPLDVASIKRSVTSPAVVVARRVTLLPDLGTGIVDAADIVAVSNGDWSSAILVVTEDAEAQPASSSGYGSISDDEAFLASVNEVAPGLSHLASKTISLIRAAGVHGRLVEKTKGRWVNTPVNSFTLKVQPRKGNLQFTIYGNPSTYKHDGFLLQDQNSYSRGWVNDESDARSLAAFAAQAHSRRAK